MYVDYHSTEVPSMNTSLSVHAIYRILADNTYQVNHGAVPGQMVFLYTDQGCGKLFCAEGEFLPTANTALLFSADTPFFYETSENHWHFWWFEFSGIPTVPKGHMYHLQKDDLPELMCKNALESLRAGTPYAASYLSCLLALSADSEQPVSKPDKEIFAQAQALIKERLYRTNISEMAQELFVDPRTLYNLFKRYSGCSPKVYIRNYVMDTASYLLLNTTKSLAEISEEIGFTNQFHFSRVFKETYGVSPREYRKRE